MSTQPPPQEIETHDEFVYDGRIVKLHIKTVQLPSGKTATREVIDHAGAVAIVPIMDDGRVMLIQQYRHAVGKVLFEIPAGTLEPNEDPNVAANRELREEIGYAARTLNYIGGIYVAPGYTTEFIHLYIARDLIYDPLAADDDEFIETRPMLMAEALQYIADGTIQDAKSVVGLLRASQQPS